MASLKVIYDLQNGNSEFRNLVTAAVCVVATAVLKESVLVANHTKRVAWANAALQNPEIASTAMVKAVAADVNVSDKGLTATDDDIIASVTALVDVFTV